MTCDDELRGKLVVEFDPDVIAVVEVRIQTHEVSTPLMEVPVRMSDLGRGDVLALMEEGAATAVGILAIGYDVVRMPACAKSPQNRN